MRSDMFSGVKLATSSELLLLLQATSDLLITLIRSLSEKSCSFKENTFEVTPENSLLSQTTGTEKCLIRDNTVLFTRLLRFIATVIEVISKEDPNQV